MSDVFREVDEEVRRERATEFAKRYGPVIGVVALVIVALVGGWRGYEYWSQRQAERAGDAYSAALAAYEDGESDDAAAAFAALSQDGPDGYRALARFSNANLLAEAGDTQGAVAAYRMLADELDTPLGDAARLRAGYLVLDTASQDEIAALLAGLDAPNSAFAPAAREILGLAAWRAGDVDAAEEHLIAIVAAPAAPQASVQRAEALLDLIAGGAYTPGQALAEAPAIEPTLTAPAPATGPGLLESLQVPVEQVPAEPQPDQIAEPEPAPAPIDTVDPQTDALQDDAPETAQ